MHISAENSCSDQTGDCNSGGGLPPGREPPRRQPPRLSPGLDGPRRPTAPADSDDTVDPQKDALLKEVCQSGFIDASSVAWVEASLGQVVGEAGFWVGGAPSSPTYRRVPYQPGLSLSSPPRPGDRALAHTHPNRFWAPHSGHQGLADNEMLTIYTLTYRGLFAQVPGGFKPIELRPGTNWLKPCAP
jgi:hypothetical protein